MDGKVYRLDEAIPGKNLHPMHPNCKCATAPTIESETDLGIAPVQTLWKSAPSKSEAVNRVLKHQKSLIRQEPVENPIVIAQDGTVYKVIGGTKSVEFDGLPDAALMNATVTHNHPKGRSEYSISRDDLDFFDERYISMMRGTDERYDYELSRSGGVIDRITCSPGILPRAFSMPRTAVCGQIGRRA